MRDTVAGQPPEGTPPADLSGFPRKVVDTLMGAEPRPYSAWGGGPWRPSSRALAPSEWPDAVPPSLEYLHRALARLLWERGGTVEAATSIRQEVKAGIIPMMAIDRRTGDRRLIDPSVWAATETAALMFWTGRAAMGKSDWNGDVYVGSEPKAANAKPSEVGPRERTTVHKLLLAMALDAYGAKPGMRSDAAKQVAAASERLWPGNGVSERTVRDWLRAAADELGPASEA